MNIAILSRDSNIYSTYRLIQEGRQRGHNMFVIDHVLCNIVVKNGKAEIYQEEFKIKNIDIVIPRIGANVTDIGLSVIRQFESMKVPTLLSSKALADSRDKIKSLQLFSQNKIPTPNSVVVGKVVEVKLLQRILGKPPWVLKIPEGTQGIGVVLSETIQSAESTIEAFIKLGSRVIVQEYIEESKASDLRVFVVGNQIVGAMKRTADQGFRSNLHRGATGVEVELTETEKEVALKAVRSMGLNVAGVDLLQSRKGALVMEVNSSPGLEGIEQNTPVNVAKEIIISAEKYYERFQILKS